LKALRAFTQHDQAVKPMIGFGDPLFNPAQDAPGDKPAAAPPGTIQSAARSVTTAAYTISGKGPGWIGPSSRKRCRNCRIRPTN
jgi:hypothetical protein